VLRIEIQVNKPHQPITRNIKNWLSNRYGNLKATTKPTFHITTVIIILYVKFGIKLQKKNVQ